MTGDTDLSVDRGRRSFLRAAGLASAAAAAPALAPVPAQAMRARPDQRAPRYRETDHVKKYYDTNRR
jgi:hypothetical protein